MDTITRRRFILGLAAAPIAGSIGPQPAHAMQCSLDHPFVPPNHQYPGQCPLCGMIRAMWARTWITFDAHHGVSQACSFHCLADWIVKSGREPSNVMLTVYHHPDETVAASKAIVVVGSPAKGTMSPVSKVVFSDRAKAVAFADACGGDVMNYAQALTAARSRVANENKMIAKKRLKKKKIVEPIERDRCPVCGMLPARYPYGKCQIRTKAANTHHFCSTQCLFAFLGKPGMYVDDPVEPLLIWVVDRSSGVWISARSAFYVVGSTKILGPMGYEALPFSALKEAEDIAAQNGGTAMNFSDVSIHKIVPQWTYRQ